MSQERFRPGSLEDPRDRDLLAHLQACAQEYAELAGEFSEWLSKYGQDESYDATYGPVAAERFNTLVEALSNMRSCWRQLAQSKVLPPLPTSCYAVQR